MSIMGVSQEGRLGQDWIRPWGHFASHYQVIVFFYLRFTKTQVNYILLKIGDIIITKLSTIRLTYFSQHIFYTLSFMRNNIRALYSIWLILIFDLKFQDLSCTYINIYLYYTTSKWSVQIFLLKNLFYVFLAGIFSIFIYIFYITRNCR